ncbi:hypothetical protein SAMN05660484_01800 [Eubacterium ruminantium]|uniref:Uncharacterized protein n=1 Tax=Eubacterium ruminantium TaxID=42322 RepID=A0A1T4P0X1_9FIRM|nr:hypothetical protein [Eubacterium ruminantium]SCW56899.1 hypothetical protein SAMN05660484_01800 [Eubacterium ruminantium]SDN07423.1 hypothetical protein SAMN04490370_109112 [Eubacterium ruminantium]SJZ85155.1 hypothetical protein SAMN02745110_01801 [Eubacterium ruminantium]
MQESKIQILAIMQPENGSGIVHLQDYIYGVEGIAPTITARDYKSPRLIVVLEDENG